MAEQYGYFGRFPGPNIDVNLYPNAMIAGINAGNAQPSTTSAIAQGLSKAISGGLATYQGIQSIEANDQSIAMNAAKLASLGTEEDQVKAGETERRIREAQAKKLEAEAQSEQIMGSKKVELEALQATNKLQNLKWADTIDNLISNPATKAEYFDQVLQDPKTRQLFNADPAYADSTLAALDGRTTPAVLDQARKSFDATEIQKQRYELFQSDARARQTEARKKQADIDNASATLQALSPRLREVMTNGLEGRPFDPLRLDVVPAGSVDLDPNTKMPKFDPEGRPIIAESSNPDDKRFYATYDGKVIDTFDETRGRDAAKSMSDYRLGASAIFDRIPRTDARKTADAIQETVSEQKTGLASHQPRVERQIKEASPQTPEVSLAPSPESLDGKTPEEQKLLTDRFNERVSLLGKVPREDRQIVRQVNSNPVLRNEQPLIKALASQESGGKNDAVSDTNVKGLLQVTGDTFDYLQNKYPTTMKGVDPKTPQGSLLAGKVYLIELLNQFNDLPLALAAYNAGPGAVSSAITASRGRNWEQVKPFLSKYVTPEKFKEVQNYPEKVLKFYSYYNG